GCTRTEIRDAFNRHRSGAEIGAALGILEAQGLVVAEHVPTPGRPVERWRRLLRSQKALSSLPPANERQNGARLGRSAVMSERDESDISDRSNGQEREATEEGRSYSALDAALDADEIRDGIEERLLEREAIRDA